MLPQVLGLTTEQELAYRDLVGLPSATGAELAERLATSQAAAEQVLRSLEQHGLVARTSSDQARFVAAPPGIALGALLARREDDIRLAHRELNRLEEVYRASSVARESTDVVDLVRGADAVRDRFSQLQLGAKEEVLALVKPPVAVVSAHDNTEAEAAAVARGVRYRVILERSMLEVEATTAEQAAEATRAGEDIRVLDELPLKLVIIDRRLAYLPVATGDATADVPSAILVHESNLLDALVALFAALWTRAVPLISDADQVGPDLRGAVDATDAQILSLLLAGLTDQAVAGQLRTSLRTVQRRVKSLMDTAGVQTRLQLGWHAAQHGWL